MALIDFILNVAGVLLWFNWRAARFDPLARTRPATLTGTLRRAEPSRSQRWHLLAALVGLVLLRGLVYWQFGPAVKWTCTLELGAISVSFRSDFLWRTLLFSALSFIVALTFFFLWLLFLSLIQPATAEMDSLRSLLRVHLGRVDRWSRAAKALLPLVAVAALWWLL